MRTPLAPVDGVYEGEDGIRQFFASIQDAGPDFRLDLEQLTQIDADRVLAFMRVSASGRTSGIAYDAETTNLYELVDGKIRRIRIYVNREEAIQAVRLSRVAMSQENVELLRSLYSSFSGLARGGDVASYVIAHYDPDCAYQPVAKRGVSRGQDALSNGTRARLKPGTTSTSMSRSSR